MAVSLQIQLLGSFSVLLDDEPIHAFRSAKARALLAYLAAQPEQEHPRSVLATLFWGDLPDAAARTNLRIELSNLNKLLGNHPALVITRNTARVDGHLAVVDAVRFHEAVASFMALPMEAQATQLHRLSTALDSYQGDFLAGFHLDAAPEFEDWQRNRRELMHEQWMLALETLQTRYGEQARWGDLADVARRQLAVQPWHEPAHRRLIQALAAQGQTQAALDQYENCRMLLLSELGVEPSPETEELVARLRQQPTAPPARHNLPLQRATFVGRTSEIERLRLLIQTERLVTLQGIGGVGKSSLARTVAQEMIHHFAYGVWFVPLVGVDAGETAHQQIALSIAAALDFQLMDMQTPLAELIRYLADKPMLLVLDNWDHLTAAAVDLLDPLLERTAVHVLATSRATLHVDGEVVVRVDGLPAADGFALFVDRARRIVPDFAVEQEIEDPSSIFRICMQVGGLPLGIELAAGWVEHFTVDEISRSIFEIESAPQQANNFVQRHRRIGGVFEYSWRLLSTPLQDVLARLSIFRGGFDRDAANAVAGSTLSDLSLLISLSLVQRVAAGRYDLHPLIQEFAAEKLSESQTALMRQRHSLHYLGALAATPQNALSRLQVDAENVRSAWQHAVAAGDAQPVRPAVTHFAEFIACFGLMTEGERLFGDAVVSLDADGENELVAQLLYQQWRFTRALRGLNEAAPLAQRVVKITQNPKLQIDAHLDLANTYAEAGAWDQANVHFESAEALLKQSSDLLAYIRVVESRIHIHGLHFRGDFAHGIARLQEMLTLLDTIEPAGSEVDDARIQLLISLSLLAVRYGDYALSIRCNHESLSQMTSINHRHKRVWLLLDRALAEQFAGLFDDAISHNLEALALAEEISAMDDVGLLSANLCLTLRQTGRLNEGLAYGRKGIEVLNTLQIRRQEGMARNRVGHTLLALQRWAEADAAYADALTVWEPLQHPNWIEAVAGRAVAAYHLGRQAEAFAGVEAVLSFVAQEGLKGAVEPVLLLLHCEEVLRGVGAEERAQHALQMADEWIHTIAGRISDDAIRRAFLARPDNQELGRRLGVKEMRLGD